MNKPYLIIQRSFQAAWVSAISFLRNNLWEQHNLVVQIKDPRHHDDKLHKDISDFELQNKLFGSKHVAYTIFPHNLYKKNSNADKDKLYDKYNNRFYPWTRTKAHRGWGTYFKRMIDYETRYGRVNQLDNIITAIKTRRNSAKAAYTIIIQRPGGETIRPLGGPCLNYIAVQLKAGRPRTLGLLAIYRNHDFLRRAYGNYWGLCNLLNFLADETGSTPGPLTCISSHAYIDTKRNKVQSLLKVLEKKYGIS